MSIDGAPLGELGAQLDVLLDALGKAVEALGDDLAGAEGQRLGALVDLDAGQRAGGLDHLRQRRAVRGLLPDRLVIEDDARDAVVHGLGGAEQHLAVVAAARFRALGLDAVEALLDGAGALVGGEDALAGRHHGRGDLFQRQCLRHVRTSRSLASSCECRAGIARMRRGCQMGAANTRNRPRRAAPLRQETAPPRTRFRSTVPGPSGPGGQHQNANSISSLIIWSGRGGEATIFKPDRAGYKVVARVQMDERPRIAAAK